MVDLICLFTAHEFYFLLFLSGVYLSMGLVAALDGTTGTRMERRNQ